MTNLYRRGRAYKFSRAEDAAIRGVEFRRLLPGYDLPPPIMAMMRCGRCGTARDSTHLRKLVGVGRPIILCHTCRRKGVSEKIAEIAAKKTISKTELVFLAALCRRCRDHAKGSKGRIGHVLTLEAAADLWLQQDGLCALTGAPLELRRCENRFRTASLDRKDSSGPYAADNLHFVGVAINLSKQELSMPDFIQMCHSVARRHPV